MDLKQLLQQAVQNNATDIHLCPGKGPLMRINGHLTEYPEAEMVMPPFIQKEVIENLLEDSKRDALFKDKVIDFSFSEAGLGRFRVNIYGQRGTFAVAIRILPYEIPPFATLGLPDILKNFTSKTKGLFLATGATGSGKSTTLASLLDILNETYNYHIITIEDPIEYLHRHKKGLVTQREIGEDAKNFAEALRSALREDPDVIMVGEMRDPETISIALTAAETGHLVLSTLHTVGAAKSIDRIVDAFPPSQYNQIRTQLAAVLEGVVSQQLIPRIDEKSVVLATDIMFVNPAIRNLIREGKHYQIPNIMQTGQSQGMQILEANLADLVHKKMISLEEAQLRAQDIQLFNQFLNRR